MKEQRGCTSVRPFRGKRLDNGEWIKGSLITFNNGAHFIYCDTPDASTLSFGRLVNMLMVPVNPSTVIQYTGLQDRNGKQIYEGDIIQHKTATWKGAVVYEDGSYKVVTSLSKWTLHSLRVEKVVVIGNIHDNPELLAVPQ